MGAKVYPVKCLKMGDRTQLRFLDYMENLCIYLRLKIN